MDDFCNANYFRHSYIIIVKQMLSSISRCALNDYDFFLMEKQKQTKMKVLLIVSFLKK